MPIKSSRKWNGAENKAEAERIAQFLRRLVPDYKERREHKRVPCCLPVTLYFDDAPGPAPGLIRDLSETGVGMILEFPVKPCEVTLRISTDRNDCLCARIGIVWCREAALHCYICGGSFIRVFEDDPI